MTNLFKQLKSKYQKRLLSESEKYSSVNTLITKFESYNFWTDLTISEFNSFCTWADVNSVDCSISDVRYGDKFIKKTKE
jgi:hypothetical protein